MTQRCLLAIDRSSVSARHRATKLRSSKVRSPESREAPLVSFRPRRNSFKPSPTPYHGEVPGVIKIYKANDRSTRFVCTIQRPGAKLKRQPATSIDAATRTTPRQPSFFLDKRQSRLFLLSFLLSAPRLPIITSPLSPNKLCKRVRFVARVAPMHLTANFLGLLGISEDDPYLARPRDLSRRLSCPATTLDKRRGGTLRRGEIGSRRNVQVEGKTILPKRKRREDAGKRRGLEIKRPVSEDTEKPNAVRTE